MIGRSQTVTLGIEAEDFQFPGDWQASYNPKGHSGLSALVFSPGAGKLPAVTALQIPKAGKYWLWVRAVDFPDQMPGTRLFVVSVGGRKTSDTFGHSGKPGYTWEPGGTFELPASPVLLGLHEIGKPYARCDAVLLTTDGSFTPTLPLGREKHPRVKPLPLALPTDADPLFAPPIQMANAAPLATLENERVRIQFLSGQLQGRSAVVSRFAVKSGAAWQSLEATVPVDETYAVVAATTSASLEFNGFFPAWKGGPKRSVTVVAGGVKMQTAQFNGGSVWDAGESLRFTPKTAELRDGAVRVTFHPSPAGELQAEWQLRPGERTARIKLSFRPARDGQYALGYHPGFRKPLAEVEELCLPMMWNRKRLPAHPVTLLDPFTPTPVALAQSAGPTTWGVCEDPSEIPFAWPQRSQPNCGLMIRDLAGQVQPSIYGPIPGTTKAKTKAGSSVTFSLRAFAVAGDWYAGFRLAADEVFAWRDYRSNVGTSLTEAALNMVDLIMDDNYGGWWKRAQGPYQIETLNGVTHSSPLTYLSLYWLTGDRELYQRRALPAMEFALSRTQAHFSPEPDHTGESYPAGGMDGPMRIFGTTTYGGFWEATRRLTPAFRDAALPADGGVKITRGYCHGEEFEEWLARHLLTGDDAALQKARALADAYLEKHVRTASTVEISPQPFYNISFVPDWEGLLRMYEVTRDQKYLDGAAFGARQLMLSVWTQPAIPAGQTTIHPGGEFTASSPAHIWWKGSDQFRLGWPRKKGDVPEKQVPAWIPSNVGLGFEQPVTYNRHDSGGAIIYQSAWAPNFLRLAAYTGDAIFETYARNTTLGRWANYPGYYVVGLTDMPLNPRYPYTGPDLGCIYYHHVAPHLAWTIDYLVAEAGLKSGGQIQFPSQRQHGYAWFDARVYGHAPGTVLDVKDAWLWFKRGLITLDNPAFNYLTAHTRDQFLVILMNENRSTEKASLKLNEQAIGLNPSLKNVCAVTLFEAGKSAPSTPATFDAKTGRFTLEIPGRALAVLTFNGAHPQVSGHTLTAVANSSAAARTSLTLKTELAVVELRAAAIQVRPEDWDAYVWLTAFPKQVRRATLHYRTGGDWKQMQVAEYPFEFSIPVANSATPCQFRVDMETPDGKKVTTPEVVLEATK